MALCLAESLLQRGGCDPQDQMTRYANWYEWGYWSSTGNCFDIGMATRAAIQRFLATGDPLAGSPDPDQAGNSSLMRLAPVPMFFGPDEDLVQRMAELSSRTTHAAPECLQACRLFAVSLSRALQGLPRSQVLDLGGVLQDGASPRLREIARGDYRDKPAAQIRGSGYVVDSLEAALWCFARHDSFEGAVLQAANLGDDADTTAAITGQLAGASTAPAALRAAGWNACTWPLRSQPWPMRSGKPPEVPGTLLRPHLSVPERPGALTTVAGAASGLNLACLRDLPTHPSCVTRGPCSLRMACMGGF